MVIVFRWWYFLGLAALVLLVMGYAETRLALRAGSEPVAARLAELEAGRWPEQPYVRLDEHVELRPWLAWSSRRKSGVDDVLYPVASAQHPFLQSLSRAVEASAGEGVERPELDGVHVFVLRDGDATDLNGELREAPACMGVLFRYDELDSGEQELVRLCAPRADLAKVMVLEADRKPKSLIVALLYIVAGLICLSWAIKRFRGPRRPVEAG